MRASSHARKTWKDSQWTRIVKEGGGGIEEETRRRCFLGVIGQTNNGGWERKEKAIFVGTYEERMRRKC